MYASDFLSRREIRRDLDTPLLAGLAAPERLVFVLGLHRSGTTYLHLLLAGHFPLATLRLFHILHYRRLLHGARAGELDGYRAGARAALTRLGILDRAIDGVEIHADAEEEYGFVLRRHAGSWAYGPRSAPLFDEMIRKLAALDPGAVGLLLKNPYDLDRIDALHERYPDARFVLIRRDPLRVLDSLFRAGLVYRDWPQPYFKLLTANLPGVHAGFRAMSIAAHLLPDEVAERSLLDMLVKGMARSLHGHYRALERVDAACYLALHYEDLTAEPDSGLRRVETFLRIPRRDSPIAVARRPRPRPLHPRVAAAEPALRRALAGLPEAERIGSARAGDRE